MANVAVLSGVGSLGCFPLALLKVFENLLLLIYSISGPWENVAPLSLCLLHAPTSSHLLPKEWGRWQLRRGRFQEKDGFG